MWLSLIRTPSSRPKRWLTPPPMRTAYFSRARRPGVVLRVSDDAGPVPATAATASRVAVAMPDRRLSEVEGGPLGCEDGARVTIDDGDGVARSDIGAVGHADLDREPGAEQAEGEEGGVEPRDAAGRRARSSARARVPGGS